MAFFSSICSLRHSLLNRRLAVRLSAAVAIPSSTSSSPPHLSRSPSASPLHKPNKTLPFTSSAPRSFPPSTSGRFAAEISSRRFFCVNSHDSDFSTAMEALYTEVIYWYGNFRMFDRAINVFESIPRNSPTVLPFNALLASAIIAGEHSQVPDLFFPLSQKHSISPDRLSYDLLVKSLCLSGKPESAYETIKEMEKKGIEVTTAICTTLLDYMYGLVKAERAEEFWNEMIENGRDPDLSFYNVKIKHKALDGRPEEVLETISELKAAGLKPDVITYNHLMTCYAKKGSCEDVRQVYEEMKSRGCDPSSATFKILLSVDVGYQVYNESKMRSAITDWESAWT